MRSKKMMTAYQNAERDAVAESDDPHGLIAVLFDELVRAMRTYVAGIKDGSTRGSADSEQFSRAMTILYGLQSSLNFEEGGEIAENLFKLYEYARQQLLETARTGKSDHISTAIDAIETIRDAWQQIEKPRKVEAKGLVAE